VSLSGACETQLKTNFTVHG